MKRLRLTIGSNEREFLGLIRVEWTYEKSRKNFFSSFFTNRCQKVGFIFFSTKVFEKTRKNDCTPRVFSSGSPSRRKFSKTFHPCFFAFPGSRKISCENKALSPNFYSRVFSRVFLLDPYKTPVILKFACRGFEAKKINASFFEKSVRVLRYGPRCPQPETTPTVVQ